MSGDTAITTGAAGRYAAALFELAAEGKAGKAVEADMAALEKLLAENAELSGALKNPVFPAGQKAAVLAALAKKAKLHALTANMLAVAAQNGRAGVLGDIARAYAGLAASARGVSTARVQSASALSGKEIEALKGALKRALGHDIDIRAEVRPELLGGLVVQVGSRMYDSSLKTKLDGLRTVMKEA